MQLRKYLLVFHPVYRPVKVTPTECASWFCFVAIDTGTKLFSWTNAMDLLSVRPRTVHLFGSQFTIQKSGDQTAVCIGSLTAFDCI